MRGLIDKMPLNLRINWGIRGKSQQKKVVSIKDFSLWLEEFSQNIGYMQWSIDKRDRKQTIPITNLGEKSRFCSFRRKSNHYQLLAVKSSRKQVFPADENSYLVKIVCFSCVFGILRPQMCITILVIYGQLKIEFNCYLEDPNGTVETCLFVMRH